MGSKEQKVVQTVLVTRPRWPPCPYMVKTSKVTQISKLKLVSQKQLGDLEPKLIWKLKGEWEWKFKQMSWVTWPSWPPCPYSTAIVKFRFVSGLGDNLSRWQNLMSRCTVDLSRWHVSLSRYKCFVSLTRRYTIETQRDIYCMIT